MFFVRPLLEHGMYEKVPCKKHTFFMCIPRGHPNPCFRVGLSCSIFKNMSATCDRHEYIRLLFVHRSRAQFLLSYNYMSQYIVLLLVIEEFEGQNN